MKLADLVIADTWRGRDGWAFQYDSEQLAKAASKQAEYHREREVYWGSEQARLDGLLREKGIELREQQVTGGTNFAAVVDPQLGQQLSEARQKKEGHGNKAKRFEAYAGAFSHVNHTYSLTIEDVDYFALHREPGD